MWEQLSWPTAAGHPAKGIESGPGLGKFVPESKYLVQSREQLRRRTGFLSKGWHRKPETRVGLGDAKPMVIFGGKRLEGKGCLMGCLLR